jgi:probable F420-dependent oxidoreductase
MGFGVLTFVTDDGIGPVELGQALEQRGFESLFLAEHSHIPVNAKTPYPAGGPIPPKYYCTLDPFVALTATAVATQNLILGTGIALLPQRDPILTAKEVASLDLVSEGRFYFGVGVGWLREEIANHGVDPSVRGRVSEERLRAMIEIWTHEKAEFHGEFVEFDPIYCWPKPVTKPYPPLYLGGGPAKFRRIARLDFPDPVSGAFIGSARGTARRRRSRRARHPRPYGGRTGGERTRGLPRSRRGSCSGGVADRAPRRDASTPRQATGRLRQTGVKLKCRRRFGRYRNPPAQGWRSARGPAVRRRGR